jgi:site-specific DNA recombinase
METGIYIRVSTEEQAKEGFSIRAQDEKLRAYARIKDWNIYNIYIDEGISGKNIEDRPAVKQLIADIVSGKVKNILVYKIDRLTRSTKNLIELIEIFNQHHCAFNSLLESIDTASATGRMFLKIIGIFAEFERENLIERVKLGLERKAKEGYSIAAFTQSYGYNRQKGDKIQEIVEEEAKTVKKIYDMYLEDDYTMSKIAKILNAENIPTKRNQKWCASTIKAILTNPTYIGKVRYSMNDAERYFEAEGKHEAIIDQQTYYQIQDKLLKIQKISRTKRPKEDMYFCGVMYCSKCGAKMTTKWQINKGKNGRTSTSKAYRCSNASKGLCDSGIFSHPKLERTFEEYITKIQDFTETTEQEQQDTITIKEIEKIQQQIIQIEKKASEIMELFMSNQIDFTAYQTMIKIGTEKRHELEIHQSLLTTKTQKSEALINKTDIIANLKENWKLLNNKERLQFIQKFIKKMVVHKEYNGDDRFGTLIISELKFNEF